MLFHNTNTRLLSMEDENAQAESILVLERIWMLSNGAVRQMSLESFSIEEFQTSQGSD